MIGKNERSVRDVVMESVSQNDVEDEVIRRAIEMGKGNIIFDLDVDGLRDFRNDFGDQIIWQRGDGSCRVGSTYLRIGGLHQTKEEIKAVSVFARDMRKRMGESSAIDMLRLESWDTWVDASKSGCDNENIKSSGGGMCPVSVGEETGNLKNKATCLICNRRFDLIKPNH